MSDETEMAAEEEARELEAERQREHLRRQAHEALHQQNGDSGYDIQPATADGEIPTQEDDREEAICGFIVFVNTDGKAIATSEIEKVTGQFKFRREADISDFRRACQEVVEDTRTILTTQSMINTQMQMAQRVQQAAQNDQLLQGLDLSKVKR